MDRKRVLRQISLLFFLSALCTGIPLYLRGTNIVTNTYAQAAERLAGGDSPYRPPGEGADQFKYSPLFAWQYLPLASLSPHTHALIWCLINALGFWTGLSLWSRFRLKQSRWLWVAFLFAAMELDISLHYQQINALLVGLVLIGAYLVEDRRDVAGAGVLAWIANAKILPAFIALSLVVRGSWKYLAALVGFSLLFLALPSLYVGPKLTAALTLDWWSLLSEDARGSGLFDIASVSARFGAPALGQVLKYAVFAISVLFIGASRLQHRSLKPLLSVSLLCLLLVSPRTESPTFVLLSPVYVFLAEDLVARDRSWGRLTWLLTAVLITVSFTDPWPKKILSLDHLGYNRKAIGALLLWMLTLSLNLEVFARLIASQKQPKS